MSNRSDDIFISCGAVMQCSLGSKTAKLKVPTSRVCHFMSRHSANAIDTTPECNLIFPPCKKGGNCLTAKKTPWNDTKKDVKIDGYPAVLYRQSWCACIVGGIITFIDNGDHCGHNHGQDTPSNHIGEDEYREIRKNINTKNIQIITDDSDKTVYESTVTNSARAQSIIAKALKDDDYKKLREVEAELDKMKRPISDKDIQKVIEKYFPKGSLDDKIKSFINTTEPYKSQIDKAGKAEEDAVKKTDKYKKADAKTRKKLLENAGIRGRNKKRDQITKSKRDDVEKRSKKQLADNLKDKYQKTGPVPPPPKPNNVVEQSSVTSKQNNKDTEKEKKLESQIRGPFSTGADAAADFYEFSMGIPIEGQWESGTIVAGNDPDPAKSAKQKSATNPNGALREIGGSEGPSIINNKEMGTNIYYRDSPPDKQGYYWVNDYEDGDTYVITSDSSSSITPKSKLSLGEEYVLYAWAHTHGANNDKARNIFDHTDGAKDGRLDDIFSNPDYTSTVEDDGNGYQVIYMAAEDPWSEEGYFFEGYLDEKGNRVSTVYKDNWDGNINYVAQEDYFNALNEAFKSWRQPGEMDTQAEPNKTATTLTSATTASSLKPVGSGKINLKKVIFNE